METQLILIRSGHYLGLLPVHYAQRWADQGELKPLLPDTLQFETQIFIITRRAAKKTLVLRRFLEDVRATFAEAARDERAVAEPAARAAG
jgi:DNA-binding transcriptional LysR family regulator